MRNAILTAAITLVLTGAMAASAQPQAQPESKQAEQTQIAENHSADVSVECEPKQSKPSTQKSIQPQREGDPEASQNRVEYGGAG